MAKRWYYKDENGNKVPVPQYKINADDYYTKAMSDSRYYEKSATDTLLDSKVSKSGIVQSTGTSTTAVMSQKAITHELDTLGSNISNIKGELHGTTQYNITVTFNSIYEYQTIDKITVGTKIKNNTNYGYHLYDKTEGTQVGTLLANSSVVLEADITSIRIMGALEVTPFEASFTIGETKEGFIEKTDKEVEILMDSVSTLERKEYLNVELTNFKFYPSEFTRFDEPWIAGTTIVNGSTGKVALYYSDSSEDYSIIKKGEKFVLPKDVIRVRNYEDGNATVHIYSEGVKEIANRAEENARFSVDNNNTINGKTLLNVNLTPFQFYPSEFTDLDTPIKAGTFISFNHAIRLVYSNSDADWNDYPAGSVTAEKDIIRVRNIEDRNVSLEIKQVGLNERVGNLEKKGADIKGVTVNVDSGTGTPSATAQVSDGIINISFHNLKGKDGEKGEPGAAGQSGVHSDDRVVVINDFSQDIPSDTPSAINVAGAHAVKAFNIKNGKAPLSQSFGNSNTARNIDGGQGKSVIIGDDNAMYANNESGANTLIGYHADYGLTTGKRNVAVGAEALDRNMIGNDNVAIGFWAVGCNGDASDGTDPTQFKSCTGNVGIGSYALHYNNGTQNVAVGSSAAAESGKNSKSGSNGPGYNVALGAGAMRFNENGSHNVCIGCDAGSYCNSDNELYIDAYSRGSNENEVKGALLYGKFNEGPQYQQLNINAGLIVMPYLPSNDPHVSGALWNDGGTLKISNG